MRKFLFILLIAVWAPRVVFAEDALSVRLLVGRSTIIDVGSAIARVSLTSSDIADALVTSANQLLINGKMPGTISMFVWDRAGAIRRYDVVVQRDLASLNDQMKELFPGERIDAQSSGKSVVLSGLVSSKEVAEKAVHVAAGYVEKKDDVVTLLQVRESTLSNQVLLQVRFAEVSRSALTELGASLFTGATGYKNVIARATTQQNPAPVFDNADAGKEKLVFSDFLNLFLFDAKHQLGTVIKALQNKGLFQSLAEPNLVAESGKEASFLAGGEFPIPVAQGTGGSTAISVQFKEFGVRLNFTPVVNGDRIHLKVRPEVSTLDFANAVVLQGFRIPALSTRRTETELELMDGQTFAIAGLINNTMNSSLQKIPGIGDIPILGLLFKSKAAQKNQTELVVMITPHLLPRNSPGVSSKEPVLVEPYLPPVQPTKGLVSPAPAFPQPGRSRTENAAPVNAPNRPEALTPAAAVAIVSNLIPAATPVLAPGDALPSRATVEQAAAAPTLKANEQPVDEHKAEERNADERKADERKVAEQAKKDEQFLQADRKQKDAEAKTAKDAARQAAKQAAREAEANRLALKAEQARTFKAAEVQGRHDAAEAKRTADDAKRQAEDAKRQADVDKKRQQQIDDATARLNAAKARYQSEIARDK
jgi:pilus assembly protein CpaC